MRYQIRLSFMSTSVKYVLDEQGNRVEVLVPIELWERVAPEKQEGPAAMTRDRLAHYAGSIRLTADPMRFQNRMRDEWT